MDVLVDVIYTDLFRALKEHSPQFVDLVLRLLEQPDPREDCPEGEEDDREWPPLPEDAWTKEAWQRALSPSALEDKTQAECKKLRIEAFEGMLRAPYPLPRLKLGALFIEMYEAGDVWAREQLQEIFLRGRIGYGIWQAFKHIYKLSEDRHDVVMFGVLAYRLDAMASTPTTGEVSVGTLIYMRRRAWRYLRLLGQAIPELYPEFAVQVLRHYPRGFRFSTSWVASHIWARDLLRGAGRARISGPPEDVSKRAFPHAWKYSEVPLLRLLEDAQSDQVCEFVIRCVDSDFPERIRRVDASWIERIGRRPLVPVQEFIVRLLTDSPEYHQSKLKVLGLHRMVLNFLRSESEAVRAYALAYARIQASEIGIPEWVELLQTGAREVQKFALAQLLECKPQEIGLDALIEIFNSHVEKEAIRVMLTEGFRPHDLSAKQFFRLLNCDPKPSSFVNDWYKQSKLPVPTSFYLYALTQASCSAATRREVFAVLKTRPGKEIGLDWFKRALKEDSLTGPAGTLLRAGKISGDELDIDWVKSLVVDERFREIGLAIVADTKLVAPGQLGTSWLLDMARHPNPEIQQFAYGYLLMHLGPEDFDDGGEEQSGIDYLFTLWISKKEPAGIQQFAANYLLVHHPEHGPTTHDAKRYGIKPRLSEADYSLSRVQPLLTDERLNHRTWAVCIANYELVRWGDRSLLYSLLWSRYQEPRIFAARVLLQIGQPEADPAQVPPREWLDASQVFALTESPRKAAREVALVLIDAHYERLGGVHRLAWLMESANREVRLGAVRLLWDRHRPHKRMPRAAEAAPNSRFDSTEALQSFLRTVLFGLPPGRIERRQLELSARILPASVAKRRLLEVVRQMSLKDRTFAEMIIPVVEEFSCSTAKGEWQACLVTLAQIRRAYPELSEALPELV